MVADRRTTGDGIHETHPEGMTETTIVAPISGCNGRIRRKPVVGAVLTTGYRLAPHSQ